jgi:aryl-alcohol dehydrogenase-like predicted oxidoreductase
LVWQYGHGYGEEQVHEAFQVSLEEGIRFIDTAELYGNGLSERLLGRFLRRPTSPCLIATKFFPWPWRFYKGAVLRALKGSLARLNVESVDLYQIHWPNPILGTTVDGGTGRMREERTDPNGGRFELWAVRMLAAYSSLARHGIPLASNQVHYSLLSRAVEKNGTLASCKELGIRLIAYSPIEKGIALR